MRLQRTHRLRDYFAKERYYIEVSDAASLCAIKEVELIQEQRVTVTDGAEIGEEFTGNAADTSLSATRKRKALTTSSTSQVLNSTLPKDDATTLDDPPTFEQLSCCYQEHGTNMLMRTSETKSAILASLVARHEFYAPQALTSFPALCQDKEQFSVVWLSDTVFMSPMRFLKRGNTEVADYVVILAPWHGKRLCFCVYSIPSLAAEFANRSSQKPEPCLAPIAFLASVVSLLPADYFEAIHFLWRREDRPQPVLKFLSIVPSQTPKPVMRRGAAHPRLIKVTFYGTLGPRLIDAVLKYSEDNRLFVRHSVDVPLQTSVNAALLKSPHLRHVHIPKQYLSQSLAGQVPFTENGSIESMSIDFCGSGSSLLKGAGRNRSLKRLYIYVGGPPQECTKFLKGHSYLLNESLSGVSKKQEVIVWFKDCFGRGMLDSVFQILDLNCVTSRSKLLHISVVTGRYIEKQGRFKLREGAASSDPWDKFVCPLLAMNWYNELYQHPLKHGKERPALKDATLGESRLERSHQNALSWKVRAVNLGIVYRKTTYHVPRNMATVNACLLFALCRQGS
jgi:hypothetical protein